MLIGQMQLFHGVNGFADTDGRFIISAIFQENESNAFRHILRVVFPNRIMLNDASEYIRPCLADPQHTGCQLVDLVLQLCEQKRLGRLRCPIVHGRIIVEGDAQDGSGRFMAVGKLNLLGVVFNR